MTTLHSPSRIHLTKEVAERLRGSYVIEYGAQPGSATDIVEADDSILAEGVIVAPDGWLRAFVSFNTFENTFVRVEFLIPLAGVIAIASEFRATGRELNQANDPKAKLLDEIEHSWKTSAGSGARG